MKHSKIEKEKFLTISANKKICKANLQLGQLYEKEKDEDGFLYLTVSLYPGFGWLIEFGIDFICWFYFLIELKRSNNVFFD